MKKTIALIMVFSVCISLVACASNSATAPTSTPTSSDSNLAPPPDPVEVANGRLSLVYDEYVSYYGGANLILSDDTSEGNMVLTIHTHHNDYKVVDPAKVAQDIKDIHQFLDLPSDLFSEIFRTKPEDGVQSRDCGNYTVNWHYWQSSGMVIWYQVNP